MEATTAAACHRKTSERQVAQLHTKTMGTNGLRKRELTFSIGPGRWPNWAIRRRQTPKGGWRQVRDDSQGLPDHLRDMRKPQRSAEHEDGKPVPECRRCVEESRAEQSRGESRECGSGPTAAVRAFAPVSSASSDKGHNMPVFEACPDGHSSTPCRAESLKETPDTAPATRLPPDRWRLGSLVLSVAGFN